MLGAVDPIGMRQFIDAPELQDSDEGLMLSSMRNQLVVAIYPDRAIFRDASGEVPTRDDFPARIASLAEYIAGISDLDYESVEIDFVIEASSNGEELPSAAILDRFVRSDVLRDTDKEAIGATVRLWYVASDRRYEIRIEPRGNEYDGNDYFAHIEVHIFLGGETPSEEWLTRTLRDEYSHFITTLSEILELRDG